VELLASIFRVVKRRDNPEDGGSRSLQNSANYHIPDDFSIHTLLFVTFSSCLPLPLSSFQKQYLNVFA
jgi:hypothetical protein